MLEVFNGLFNGLFIGVNRLLLGVNRLFLTFEGESHIVFTFCVREDLSVRKSGGRGEEGRRVIPVLACSDYTTHSTHSVLFLSSLLFDVLRR